MRSDLAVVGTTEILLYGPIVCTHMEADTGIERVCRFLPEVQTIDGRIGAETCRVIAEDVPSCVWVARSSESHHPPDERGCGGLWLHTKRVFTAWTMLDNTFEALGVIDGYESNCARSAVLLHDMFKYGRTPAEVVVDEDRAESDTHEYADGHLSHLPAYTDSAHDVQMAEFVRTRTVLPEEVAECIEAHGGSTDWASHAGRSPSNDLELGVHLADVIASNPNHRLPVIDPATELIEMTGEVPTIDRESMLS